MLVRPELLAQLNLREGDELLIGTQTFQIRGVIQSEPGRNLGAFSLGSRVFIDLADLPSTGLLSFGSRASHQLLLQVPSPPPLPGRRDPSSLLATELSKAFVNDFVGVRSYRQNEGRMNRNLERAENYLSLVGLVVLILGGIGVSSVTRVFVQQKVKSIAILKCVGSTSHQVLAIYLTQVVLLGLAGSALGVAIAAAALQLLPVFVGNLAELLQVDYGLTAGAVLQGLAIGVLVSLLFSVVPLLEVRNVKPSLLLRQDIPALPNFDWLKWIVATSVGAALVGVAAWQAGSLQVGLMLSGGFVALTFVLHLAGLALIRAVQPLRFSRSFALRQAVLHVARPGNQTRIILLAVGLGTFFILGVRALQVNLLQDFSVQVGEDAPDMFLMDIQSDQRDRAVGAHRSRERGRRCSQAHPGAARQDHRRSWSRRESRELRGCARTRRPVARVHHHLSIDARGKRDARRRNVVGRKRRHVISPRSRSKRASASVSISRSATKCGSTCSGVSCRRASPAFVKSTSATSAPVAS